MEPLDVITRFNGTEIDSIRTLTRTVAAASQWLSSRGANRPFFLWVHLFDPHEPYAPPTPFSEQFADRPYDGEIAFTDQQIGRLMARLEQLGPKAVPLADVTARFRDDRSGVNASSVRLHIDGHDVTGWSRVTDTDVSFRGDLREGRHHAELHRQHQRGRDRGHHGRHTAPGAVHRRTGLVAGRPDPTRGAGRR